MSQKYISTAMGTLGYSGSVCTFSCKEMLVWIRSVNILSFRVEKEEHTDNYGIYLEFVPVIGGSPRTNYIYTNNKSLTKHLEKGKEKFAAKLNKLGERANDTTERT